MTAEPETALGTILFLLFVMGAIVIFMVARETRGFRAWRRSDDKNVEKMRDQFAELMSERLGIAMRAAELDKTIVDKWDDWPLEYRPTLYQVLRHTQLLEETMYEEAVAKGIYPRRILEGPLITSQHPAPTPLPDTDDAPPSSGENVVRMPEPRREWINGQLLRTG